MIKALAKGWLFAALLVLCNVPNADGREFWRQKWFDYPDPATMPKTTVTCVKLAKSDVPCPTWDNLGRMCEASTCIGHSTKIELLRTDVVFVATGPDSAESAVVNAIHGYVAGCGAAALVAANSAAAAVQSPEPVARAGAGVAAAFTSFKGCIPSISAAGIVGSILKQVELKVESPTHWAPV